MKVLVVVTSHDQLGNTGKKTGFWLEELAAPYYVFKEAGVEMTLASPKGGRPPLDPKSNEPDFRTDLTLRFEKDAAAQAQLDATARLDSVSQDNFDTVFYPGGHGPMEDLWQDADSGRLLVAALASGKPLAIVCHAPVAIMATRKHGVSPFAGYRVTAYTNDEEDAVGLRAKARWTAEDELVKLGVDFSRGEKWQPYTVVDRNLFTGQNPASAAPLAREFMKELS